MHLQGTLVYVLAITLIVLCVLDPTEANKKMKFKKKKRLADLNDQEVDKLYDEWEENEKFSKTKEELKNPDEDDEEDEEDEEDARRRGTYKPKPLNLNFKNMQDMQHMDKKGKQLMIIVTITSPATISENEDITSFWQNSLFNANVNVRSYPIDDTMSIFMVEDGALAGRVKDYLVKQDRCLEVSIDKEKYPGRGALLQKEQGIENTPNKVDDEL